MRAGSFEGVPAEFARGAVPVSGGIGLGHRGGRSGACRPAAETDRPRQDGPEGPAPQQPAVGSPHAARRVDEEGRQAGSVQDRVQEGTGPIQVPAAADPLGEGPEPPSRLRRAGGARRVELQQSGLERLAVWRASVLPPFGCGVVPQGPQVFS